MIPWLSSWPFFSIQSWLSPPRVNTHSRRGITRKLHMGKRACLIPPSALGSSYFLLFKQRGDLLIQILEK